MLERARTFDALAVDDCSVAAPYIADCVAAVLNAYRGVRGRHRRVGDHDIVPRSLADLSFRIADLSIEDIARRKQNLQCGLWSRFLRLGGRGVKRVGIEHYGARGYLRSWWRRRFVCVRAAVAGF